MEKILLIGGGGHCVGVIDSIKSQKTYEIVGIIDLPEKLGQKIAGYEVIGTDNDLEEFFDNGIKKVFLTLGSIGNCFLRQKLAENCKKIGYEFATIIDPTAIIARNVVIKNGVYVGKGVIINNESIIEENAIINTGSIIEHNCNIGRFCHIAPGVTLGGNVVVNDYSHVGLGSSVIQNITIGNNSLIGSHSNVINDIPDHVIAYGNPCKVVSEK